MWNHTKIRIPADGPYFSIYCFARRASSQRVNYAIFKKRRPSAGLPFGGRFGPLEGVRMGGRQPPTH